MVTENTNKNRKRLALRSTDFAQAHPFGTLVSEQDASSNKAPVHTHLSRRIVLKAGLGAAVVATGIGTWLGWHADTTHAILLGNNAAIQWDNAVLQAIRIVGMGPTAASRAIAITHTCMYDAWATYDAVAVATRPNGIPRQAGQYTDATMAVSYAAYRALLDLFPSQASLFTTQMNNLGFDPSNTSTDTTTQVGVGNVAAQAVLAFRHTDGSNQAGNYADTSGYVPVNTPDQIIDPTRWQPLRVSNGNGGFIAQYLSLKYKHGLNNDVKMFFALSNALFDAGIAAWDCKRAYDYVRPITAVHYLYIGQQVTAWAGYGKGTQSIDGGQWIPFQEPTIVTPPFPEYVSGHSTFSAAGAYILQQVTGSDLFGDSSTALPDSSHIEPGITPVLPVVLLWLTLSYAAEQAGLSRRYGGIHFLQGDLGGGALSQQGAGQAWGTTQSYINGREEKE